MKIWLERSILKDHYVEMIKNSLPTHEIVTDLSDASDAEVAITMPQFVKKEMLDQIPHLKFIKLLTAGYNQINLADIKQRGITLAYAKDVFSIQIAEDVVAKILYFNRRLPLYDEHMRKHEWVFERVDHELYHSTVGIIGAGSIGTEVAKRLKAFGCHILGYRRNHVLDANYDELFHDRKGLESLLERSDYIIIALPLSDETKHFIGENEFKHMKNTALIINVARGEVIDQKALINALNQGFIRGAGLDVTTPEPLPQNDPLWQARNIFITPHQASSSPMIHERLMLEVIDTLNAYFEDRPLTNLVTL